jgi:ketosteroid isomerase-like protein
MNQKLIEPTRMLARSGKLAILASASLVLTAAAHPAEHHSQSEPSSAALDGQVADASPIGTVKAFHAALTRGDTEAALDLLTENASIFESGNAESSRAEYAAHHLQSDIAFSGSVQRTLVDRSSGTNGDTAWVMSIETVSGTFRERPVKNRSAETMLLNRVDGQWRIAHIHWSSAKLDGD